MKKLLLIGIILVIGCGKKQPIGYDLIKDREGKVDSAKGKVILTKLGHKFNYISETANLFAGNEKNFYAISFIQFEFDTLVIPETLYITGIDTGRIIIGFIDSINFDSVNWSNKPDFSSFANVELKDTITKIAIPDTSDSCFYFAFAGELTEPRMCSFYSHTQDEKPKIKIKNDTILTAPMKSTYIDTSDFSSDSLSYIELGHYLTICTLYINLRLYKDETTFIEIDSLTDAIIDTFGLDSVKINDAKFITIIDTINSYKWKNAVICAKYEDIKTPLFQITNDTIKLAIDEILSKWFNNAGKLFFTIEGVSNDIARIFFNYESANISVIYTHPPKPRK